MSKAFERIKAGLEDAIAYADGDTKDHRVQGIEAPSSMMNGKNMRSSLEINGQTIDLEWIKTQSTEGITPITQVYGICFNKNGEILVCREDKDGNWQLPGGKPEAKEEITETLQREILEEVTVEVDEIQVLGLQKVNYPNNPNKIEGDNFYQVRMICQVKNVLPSAIDPATGKIWERKFVPANAVTEYIKWGSLGETMFQDAIETYSNQK